ncbi:hypothetical protein R5R35_011741 [Gryllus longicercus]|uniref:Uncharacterized protein n=1 Tax=Gryllus longicercus TaxID=2509291 RepID=A0AAN9VBU0_9ORTH
MANSLEEIMQRRLKDYLQSSGTISGYVEDFENLFTELEASGYSYSIRHSRPCVGIKFHSKKLDKTPEIKYFGSPFQAVKTTYYKCSLGHKYYDNSQKDEQVCLDVDMYFIKFVHA